MPKELFYKMVKYHIATMLVTTETVTSSFG